MSAGYNRRRMKFFLKKYYMCDRMLRSVFKLNELSRISKLMEQYLYKAYWYQKREENKWV